MSDLMMVLLDLGGTNLRVVVTDNFDSIDLSDLTVIPNENNYDVDLAKIVDVIKEKVGNKKLAGIAIGLAGTVEDDVRVKISQNLSSWNKKDLAGDLKKQFGSCPVFLRNDATMAALGEAEYGRVELENFLYVIWGTGIGGCLVKYFNNRPLVENLDWWEYFEEWESECSGRLVEERFGKPMSELGVDEWEEILNRFFQHAVSVMTRLKCPRIVLGGGVAFKQADRIKKYFYDYKIGLQLSISVLGEEAGLYGALSLLKKR